MHLEILKTKIEVKVFGQTYDLKPPTAKKAAEFSKSLKGVEDDCLLVDQSCNFLIECGLPKEVCEELELDHLEKLISAITTKKKLA